MCGIVGFFKPGGIADERTTLLSMTHTLSHRGPDDEGIWLDPEAGIGLGHRRLAIIDLSSAGHQPMISPNGRYVITYNGEIYNFNSIRQELMCLPTPPTLHGTSDTEVLIAAFEVWGIQRTLERCVGMFSFGVWDKETRSLFLARDRLGEKPLYYGWVGDTFVFGSELKALRQHPNWRGRINRNALALYMRYMYIPGPFSIFEDIYKLSPGTSLCIDASQSRKLPPPVPYWSAKKAAEYGNAHPFTGTETEAIDQLESLLKDAVSRQMISDVPLGAFLSGGIDSSTVVALMQMQSSRPVRTFSIGFAEQTYNEAEYAKAVAEHLKTEHTELYVSPQQTRDVIPKLPMLYDEPFADSSQVPTHLLAELTREHVTVALSGDGGDELFAGYPRYQFAVDATRQTSFIPQWMQRPLTTAERIMPDWVWNGASQASGLIFRQPNRNPVNGLRSLIHTMAEDPVERYRHVTCSHWHFPEQVVINGQEPLVPMTDYANAPQINGLVERLTYFDTVMYLPDDILVKVDRASMGVSLEVRVPLLDHRVVEFAQRVPMAMKMRTGENKWLLRQVLYRHVPQKLIDRPKMGFGVPIDSWLRVELRDWAESLLDTHRLKEQGFFNVNNIHEVWQTHLERKLDYHYLIWDVLMFQAWYEAWEQS